MQFIRISLRLSCAALLIVIVFSASAFPQQIVSEPQLAQLPLDALFALPKIAATGPVALSPDGELVSYPVCDIRDVTVETDARYKALTRAGTPRIYEGCELRITNTRTRETLTPLKGGDSWSPVWSPTGQALAFFSDHDGIANLWIWHRLTRKATKVSTSPVRSSGKAEPQWMPDSKGVLATTLPADMSLDQAASMSLGRAGSIDATRTTTQSSVVLYSTLAQSESTTHASAYDTSQFFRDLVLFDLSAMTRRTIASRKKIWGFRVSPDGKSVAFTTEVGFESSASHLIVHDLHIYDLATSQTRNVANGSLGDGRSYSWSPDSRNIAYFAKGNCFVVSRDGGEPRNVTPGEHPRFSRIDRLPLWDSKGANLYVLSFAPADAVARGYVKAGSDGVWIINIQEPSVRKTARISDRTIIDVALSSRSDRVVSAEDGVSLILLTIDEHTKRSGLYRVNLTTGTTVRLYEKDEVISNGSFGLPGYTIDTSADGKTITYLVEDSQHPPELYVSDAEFKYPPRQLTNLGNTIKNIPMGKTKLIEWRGYDGNLYRGAVLLPSGYREGQLYPTIVYPYPGDARSEYINLFGMFSGGSAIENMQVFATRGYVVFMPDMPARKLGRPMHSLVEGILPAMNKIIDLGIADPERLGVMGHSYGGYMVLSFIVQTNRFKAAVARAGIYDLAGEYGYMTLSGATFAPAWAESGQGGMGGTPWEYRERYIENSPFFYLDRVETPLLLIHGSEDSASSPSTANQVFVGLRRLGKQVEYAKYMGEGHTESGWGYANQLDYMTRLISWFDKHLKSDDQKAARPIEGRP